MPYLLGLFHWGACRLSKIWRVESKSKTCRNGSICMEMHVMPSFVLYAHILTSGGSRICEKGGPGIQIPRFRARKSAKIGQKKQKSAEKKGGPRPIRPPPWIRHCSLPIHYAENCPKLRRSEWAVGTHAWIQPQMGERKPSFPIQSDRFCKF